MKLTTWGIWIFFFSSEELVLTQDHNYSQAKLYHTKLKHFRPTFSPFWPILRAKVPKNHRNQIEWAQPLNLHIWTEHILVVWALGEFIRIRNASDYMCVPKFRGHLLYWEDLIHPKWAKSDPVEKCLEVTRNNDVKYSISLVIRNSSSFHWIHILLFWFDNRQVFYTKFSFKKLKFLQLMESTKAFDFSLPHFIVS